MRRGILIALLVPAVAIAGPRHRKKKRKAAPPPVEKKTEPVEATPAPTPEPPQAPTAPASPTDAQPIPPSTFTPPPGSQPTVPAPAKSGTGPVVPGATPASVSTPPGAPAAQGAEPPEPDQPEGKEVDVDSLRQEYLALRDELFKSRARANAVASQLYSTRISIKLTWGSARHYSVTKASIRLDGATVYEDATGAIANDDGVRFTGYVAPGRHLVTFHVEATGKDDDSFTSSTESQVVVKAVANKDLMISAKGHDNGDIAYEWKRSEKGSYGLGIDVAVKAVAGGSKK